MEDRQTDLNLVNMKNVHLNKYGRMTMKNNLNPIYIKIYGSLFWAIQILN